MVSEILGEKVHSLLKADSWVIVDSNIEAPSDLIKERTKRWQEDWDNGICYPYKGD